MTNVRSNVPTAERAFHYFTRLPAEIRVIIWRLCLPNRIHELDIPSAPVLYEDSPCSLMMTTVLNAHPPLITRVCRESRAVAFEQGSFASPFDFMPVEAQYFSDNVRDEALWLDDTRNSTQLNWFPAYAADWGGGDDGPAQPLRSLAWHMGMTRSSGSFMVQYLDQNYGWTTPNSSALSEHFRIHASRYRASERCDILDILGQRPEWLIVMRTVVTHAPMGSSLASGLFGLLGDAPVQVIDVADVEKINAMFAVAEECEHSSLAEPAQDFRRDTIHELEQQLSMIMKRYFDIDRTDFRLRPAIMFRLCPLMCNHPTEAIAWKSLPRR